MLKFSFVLVLVLALSSVVETRPQEFDQLANGWNDSLGIQWYQAYFVPAANALFRSFFTLARQGLVALVGFLNTGFDSFFTTVQRVNGATGGSILVTNKQVS